MDVPQRNGQTLGLALGLAFLAGAAAAAPAEKIAETPLDAVAAGKPILDLRARYEDVDQANLANDAQSFTVRARFGWETATWRGFKVLVEGAAVVHGDDGHYNVAVPGGASLNGATQYPIVNDPSTAELNRAQLVWAPAKTVAFTVGRQRVLIDDQRFIGNSGWRQDEQTFDAARADLNLGPVKATYVYAFHVNRIFGRDLDWRSASHIFNASYAPSPALKLEGFVYALAFDNAATSSTLTGGVRASGKLGKGPVKLTYDGTWARQTPYGPNTEHFTLDFWQAGAAVTWGRATLKADYERLGGNGTRGFITPLATTHGFQGWADAFAAVGGNKTHVDGLTDFNVTLSVRPPLRLPFLSNPEILVRRHDFWAATSGAKLGGEWDAQVQAAVTPKLNVAVKYADFRRNASVPAGTVLAPPSRTKVWLTLEFKL